MKKVISTTVALGFCLYLPAAALAGGGATTTNESILRELQALRDQVSKQQAEIDMLKGQKVAPVDLSAEQKRLDALEAKKGFVVSGNEFIDGIKLKGDLRVRYDMRDQDLKDGNASDSNRDRIRSRFRLGGVWDNKAESWQVGAGVATGDDNPVSTFDSWSENKPFETGDLRLDYAYAKHKLNDFSMIVGQSENPYTSSWVLWNTNLRLAGLTMAYGQKEGVFATGGAYGAKLVQGEDVSMLYMGQVGYKGKFSEKGNFTVATGYHIYGNEMINEEYGLDHDAEADPKNPATKSQFGLGSVDPNAYELSIGDLYGDVNMPAGPVNLKMYGHIWKNFGADGKIGQSQAGSKFPEAPGDNDLGWVLGIDTKFDNFRLGYAYSMVEADSLFGYLGDQDFGDGLSKTNKKGHRVQLGYDIAKNWAADVSFFNYERITDFAAAKEDSVNLYQFDISYKF